MPDGSERPGVPRTGRLPGAHERLPGVLAGAFWALIVAAVASIIVGLVQRGQVDWLRESAQQRVEDDPSLKMPTDDEIHSYVNAQMIGLVLIAMILALIGLQILRGRTRARWYVFGIFVLATIGVLPILPFVYLGVPTALTFITSDDAPLAMTIPVCIAAAATFAAFVLTMLPPARAFFAERKAEDDAAREAAGKTRRPSLFASVLRPPMRPETQAALDKAGIATRGKRSKAPADAAPPEAARPPKTSLSKSRAAADPSGETPASTARRKGRQSSR